MTTTATLADDTRIGNSQSMLCAEERPRHMQVPRECMPAEQSMSDRP